MADEPLRHLRRVSPPWVPDDEHMTECGRLVIDVAAVETFDDAVAFSKKHGRQRAAFVYCATCLSGATGYIGGVRRQTWENQALEITQRWLNRTRYTRGGDRNVEPDRYLHALAALVAAHQDEFDAMVTPPEGVVDLSSRRKGATR